MHGAVTAPGEECAPHRRTTALLRRPVAGRHRRISATTEDGTGVLVLRCRLGPPPATSPLTCRIRQPKQAYLSPVAIGGSQRQRRMESGRRSSVGDPIL